MKQLFSIVFFTVAYSLSFKAQLNYAEKLAATIMNTYKDSMVVKKFAAHLLQDNQVLPGQTIEQAQQSRPAVWNYEMGVILIGLEKLAAVKKEQKYADYAKHLIDHFIAADGSIRTYILEEYNFDNIPSGRQLLHLYKATKDEKYKTAAGLLYKQLAWQPRNKIGGYLNKLKYPMQIWLDGVYMADPFAAKYAAMLNDTQKLIPGNYEK